LNVKHAGGVSRMQMRSKGHYSLAPYAAAGALIAIVLIALKEVFGYGLPL
jgi:hypothetical protein